MGIKQKLSVEEYLALPEEKPYLEYVRGERYRSPCPIDFISRWFFT